MDLLEFEKHRNRLFELMPNASMALLPSAKLLYRNGDAEHHFRQDSDFFYLTGFPEPDAVAVLIKWSETEQDYMLFSAAEDPKLAQWVGPQIGQQRACSEYLADCAYPITELDEHLLRWLPDIKQVFYPMASKPGFDEKMNGLLQALRAKVRGGGEVPSQFADLSALIASLRLIKSDAEIKVMRRAAEISAKAHCQLMKACRPGINERELEGVFIGALYAEGVRDVAYSPIVGGGENACILHYIDNDSVIEKESLVLVDAGAEVNCYASDITRTFPADGVYSDAQKALYDCVLNAQLAAIELVRPGSTWMQVHSETCRVLTEGLVKLGILTGEVSELLEQEAYKPFYMHKTGHWLGIDVHDVGNYKADGEWRVFEPGMVMTIEPGLYIQPSPDVDKCWWNIGIRIEDDVLVTESGHEVLTSGVPKSTAEIEALMRG